MNKSTLIGLTAALIVTAHILFFFWLISNRANLGPDDLPATLGIVVPLFGASVAAVVQYYLAHQTDDGSAGRVSVGYAAVTLVLTIALFAFVFMVVTLQMRKDVFNSSKDYIAALALAETVFGVHAARLIQSLFGLSQSPDGDGRRPGLSE